MVMIFNVVWFLLVGWWNALLFLILSGLFMITLVGIPIGKALYNFSILHAFPFGKEILRETELKGTANVSLIRRIFGTLLNILWLPLGLAFTIVYIVAGLAACLTIIGIPTGIVYMRMGKFLLFPIGAKVVAK